MRAERTGRRGEGREEEGKGRGGETVMGGEGDPPGRAAVVQRSLLATHCPTLAISNADHFDSIVPSKVNIPWDLFF